MKKFHLGGMEKGWFVGDFSPTAFATQSVEVGVKKYKAGDKDLEHFHKIGTEITLVLSGTVLMNDHRCLEGDIIVVDPLEKNQFTSITDSVLIVIKVPGAKNDKYFP